MARGTGPRWIVTTAVTCLSIIAFVVVIWTCLPVSRSMGPVHLHARPTRIGAQTFLLTISNDSASPRAFVNRPAIGSTSTSHPELYQLDFVHPHEKEERLVDTEAAPSYATYSGAHFGPGLHRTFIHSVNARTDVWVFVWAGRVYAVK